MYTKIVSISRTIHFSQILVPVAIFTIPFCLAGPQILVGTLVNALLFYSARKSDQKFLFAICAMPSLAALAHGVLFAKFTPLLLYFLPFIWLGNIVLIKTFQSVNGVLPVKVVISAIFKTLILYLSALIFFKLQIIPQLFVTSMGIVQLVTALFGGTLAFSILKIWDERSR